MNMPMNEMMHLARRNFIISACCALLLLTVFKPFPVMARVFGPPSIADLVEKLSDSVVNISTLQNIEGEHIFPVQPLHENMPFQDFLNELFNNGQQNGAMHKARSLGSGFVVDQSGLIVTNNHVVADADEIVVNFNNGDKLKAEVVGHDSKMDLAVLRIQPKTSLKALDFGDSEKLRVGDWVMAIGNPFGLGGSVTVGIVSARNRNINAGPYDNFIQTDTAINRGNSGGPLFDMKGNVIGINTAIYSMTGGSVGVSFAVPSNAANRIVTQLVKFGQVRRGWIGVRVQNVTDEIAESLDMEKSRGALVIGVDADSPSDKGGIEVGDVIISFDGKPISIMHDLPNIVSNTNPSKEVSLVILRDGKEKEIRVTVGLLKDESSPNIFSDDRRDDADDEERLDTARVLGAEMSPLDLQLRKQFNISKKVEGVIILLIDSDSPLAEKDITPGSVIVEVASKKVREPGDITAQLNAIKKKKRKSALFLLSNGIGDLRFVALPVPD